MGRIHTIYNINTIRFHCFQCSHPTFFSFSRFFLSVLSADVTDASFRKPCDHHFEHVCKVFLNTWLFSVKLSSIIFIVIPCITNRSVVSPVYCLLYCLQVLLYLGKSHLEFRMGRCLCDYFFKKILYIIARRSKLMLVFTLCSSFSFASKVVLLPK